MAGHTARATRPSAPELAAQAVETPLPAPGVAVLVGLVPEALVGQDERGAVPVRAEFHGHLGLVRAGHEGFPRPGVAQGPRFLHPAILPRDEAGLRPAGQQHADAIRPPDPRIDLADG